MTETDKIRAELQATGKILLLMTITVGLMLAVAYPLAPRQFLLRTFAPLLGIAVVIVWHGGVLLALLLVDRWSGGDVQ